jgi:hypothetical protein
MGANYAWRLALQIGRRDAKVAANLPREELINFAMPWHGAGLIVDRIEINGMIAAFTK